MLRIRGFHSGSSKHSKLLGWILVCQTARNKNLYQYQNLLPLKKGRTELTLQPLPDQLPRNRLFNPLTENDQRQMRRR